MADKTKTTEPEPEPKVAALVLPVEAAGSVEPQVLAGFPGRWVPGEPVALTALDLSERDARRLTKDLPLVLVKVEAPRATFAREQHGDTAALAAEAQRTADAALKDPGSVTTQTVTIPQPPTVTLPDEPAVEPDQADDTDDDADKAGV